MAIYKYRAKKGPKEVIESTVEAYSEKEAIEKISQMGYLPVFLEERKDTAAFSSGISAGPATGRVKPREVTIFSRELASLLKSGVPILNAINIILEQTDSRNFQAVLRNIYAAVKEGTTFSSALSRYPKVFSSLYIALIRAGEDSGVLPDALLRIAEYRLKQEEALSRFRMAMAYPALMAIVGIATIVFMLTFVMPRLMQIFINMGQDLPLPTRILISVSAYLKQWRLWVILAAVVLIIRRQSRTGLARPFFSRLKLHLPIFGNFMLKAELARFNRTMELLLKSGITILRAIEVALPVVDNEVIREQLKLSYKELEQGGSFGRSLKNSKLFPVFMTNLIIVGEESGKLTEALSEVAFSYERDTDEAMKVMTNLLEPLMILTVGLIAGFIVIAMLLPIFEMNMMVR
ncbi:MAG: type II secretion system F family protein [Candidatus Omnitrophota bacterium]